MAEEQLVEQVADQVADQIQEVAEVTRRLTGREVGFFAIGAGIGVAVGFAVGYKVAEKRLQTKFQKITEQEIAEMREHYQKKMVAAQEKPSVEEIIEEKARYSDVELRAIDEANAKFPAEEESVQVNVFETVTETEVAWDYALEHKRRKMLEKDVPYIIHFDEFTENEPEHEQLCYTYYEMDDILADQHDNTIDDMDAVIGLGNLGRWGHGSPGDPNIVHIRNEHLKLDFEVVHDRGSFAEETGKNIRHSYNRRRRISRRFDDD